MPRKKLEEVQLFQAHHVSSRRRRHQTVLRREQNEPEILSTSESCRQPESHWKEHRLLLAHWRH